MDTPIEFNERGDASMEFVTETDEVPDIWNYLLGLRREDLVAELVQNDLDQDATRTVITFERDRLLCEGNGKPVDQGGWLRLRKIKGAGDKVPAKRGKIGIKNHGLKTAFTIGDEIRVMSAGQAIVQTLYRHGRNRPPYPGASERPVPDPRAPTRGCRIAVRYRDKDMEPQQGEAATLSAMRSEEIDALFTSACASVPDQFAGIVSPEVAPRYEIVLKHWRLGEARFTFSCTRPRKIAKRMEAFRRRCTVDGTASLLPEGLEEQAFRRFVPLTGPLARRVADFYRRGDRCFVEVSWPIDRRGRPKTGTGRFRYPIGYPKDSQVARTAHGVHFNAPIVSDNARHGPAGNEATNRDLRAECEALLIDVLAGHAIPKWGPEGLNPLVPSSHTDDVGTDEAIRPLLAALVVRNAIPTLKWRAAVELLGRRVKFRSSAAPRRSVRREPARRYDFIVPAVRGDFKSIHAALLIFSPRSERQVHPLIHRQILRLFADGRTEGFPRRFVTFDERDALDRAMGKGNEYFDAPDGPEELADLGVAWSCLDVIGEAIALGECDAADQAALRRALVLQNSGGELTSFGELHAGASVPAGVPGLSMPPILHPELAAHPLLRKDGWRLPRYMMSNFLESGALSQATTETRWLFWKWLRQNGHRLRPQEKLKLANLPIWPDSEGGLCVLADLCDPPSERVAAILRGVIRRPHDVVRRSQLLSTAGKSRLSIRRRPSEPEIRTWLDGRLATIPFGSRPSRRAVAALRRFEGELAVLARDFGAARIHREADVGAPALAWDGAIRLRCTLVAADRDLERLALPPRHVLKPNPRAAILDALAPPLTVPTTAMMLDCFSEDAGNFAALQARLSWILNMTEPHSEVRRKLAEMPIIPVSGRLYPPSALAFLGSRGDYWGSWKTRLPAVGLSQDDQRRYREAGVTSASPNRETSRAFLEWLSAQEETVLQRHMPCVLRHILHADGPTAWAAAFPETPFIPAEARDGVQLLSLRDVRTRPVYLPDALPMASAVRDADPHVLLTIQHVKEVVTPITDALRKLGITSLRAAIKEPESVSGTGDVVPAGDAVAAQLRVLQAPGFGRSFLKRLAEIGVASTLVRHDWGDRISAIRTVVFADRVEARHRFRGMVYPVRADGGFDPSSGTFWVGRGNAGELRLFHDAVAAHLIFEPAARPVDWGALERALAMEFIDRSFGHTACPARKLEYEGPTAGGEVHDLEGEGESDAELGEAVFGHSPFVPDPARNAPSPRPLSSIPNMRSRIPSSGSPPALERGSGEERSVVPPLEKRHVEDLRLFHYASHCQICLCSRPPRRLAPPQSYVASEEVRRRVVEAHHVDLKSVGGARHAGNLVLLCKLHHDNYGRRLTRDAITAALRGRTNEKTVHFGGAGTVVKGRQIEVAMIDTGDTVALFFTDYHAAYWLSQTRPAAV